MTAASWAIGNLLKKHIKVASAKPGEFTIPEIEEGAEYPVVFGTCRVSPLIAWWGKVSLEAIRRHYTENRWCNNKRVYYTIGYHYKVGIHFILTTGFTNVKQVYVADKLIWPNPAYAHEVANDDVTSMTINQPGIFGGEAGEGGIVGSADIMHGSLSQQQNDYLKSILGNDISAYRGVTSVVLKDMNVGTSPYPKSWSFLCTRTKKKSDGSTQWYLEKADINADMNPVHILRECYTDPTWGFGYSVSLFEDAIWKAAADTLYNEEFGISRLYDRTFESLTDFVKEILRHIDAVIYQDMDTGNFIIKLIRDDYNIEELEIFDKEQIVSVDDFYRSGYSVIPTQLDVNFWDYWNNIKATITDTDISIFQKQGRHITGSVDYYGVTNPDIALMLASRDHRQMASFLASFKVRGSRFMSHLKPGDVIIVNFQGLGNMVARISGIRYGELTDGILTFDCMEDVFAVQEGLYVVPETGWVDPYIEPLLSPDQSLLEVPFFLLYLNEGYEAVMALAPSVGYLLIMAAFAESSPDFELKLRGHTDQEFVNLDTKDYTCSAILNSNIPQNAQDIWIDFVSGSFLSGTGNYAQVQSIIYNRMITKGELVFIDDEAFLLVDWNLTTKKFKLKRGVLDTVPQTHSSGKYIYFPNVATTVAEQEIDYTKQPGIKVMPNTVHGTLPEGDAPIVNGPVFNKRLIRPYPPGKFEINSQSYPQYFSDVPTISWTHRNRLTQLTRIIQHNEASIGPEAGTTYTLKIYGKFEGYNKTLLRTEVGLTGESYVYSHVNERLDSGYSGDCLNWKLEFELYSVRNGYSSFQKYDLAVKRDPRLFNGGLFGEGLFGDWQN